MRSNGDSDDGVDVEAQLLPVAARRSLELAQGDGHLLKHQQAREEASPTQDDLELAVETIENAKARVGRRRGRGSAGRGRRARLGGQKRAGCRGRRCWRGSDRPAWRS
jgi:hypothetical protein